MRDVAKPGVIEGRRVVVESRLLTRRDGREERREMVVHPGSVVLLPLLDDGRLLLIRQHRFAVARTLLELPAGTLEPGEEIATCAARELEEETGHRATTLDRLFGFFSAPGGSNEHMHVFLARGLVATAQRLDPAEEIEVAPLSMSEVLARIHANEIEDAKTIAAVLYFATFGELSAEDAPRQTWVGP